MGVLSATITVFFILFGELIIGFIHVNLLNTSIYENKTVKVQLHVV